LLTALRDALIEIVKVRYDATDQETVVSAESAVEGLAKLRELLA
jgi:hypothetical protein